MQDAEGDRTPLSTLPGAKTVAWKHPTGEPVWAVALSDHPDAARIVQFLGGATGHRLWSESKAGFTIVSSHKAEAYQWVVENRTARTYPMTAQRMLREIGGIRKGICIDVGCGPGHLDVELAKRSEFTIIGLDIDPDMKPLFEKTIRKVGLQDRVSFVLGDAQKMPFPDDYADVIVSRGTLIFIPDLAKCLREVDRVLKPTGVAFLGGRYLYAPQQHKMTTEKLKQIVKQSGVPGAQVIESRGQWVKIVGPQAPESAQKFQGGPGLLAGRILADYGITEGKCLLIHRGDGGLEQALQQGLVETTDVQITALYAKQEIAETARQRIQKTNLSDRIECRVGDIHELPFEADAFDLVVGVGPVLIWGDRPKAMRELYRVLREGGAALVGGRYLSMPEFRKVSSEALRQSAAETGIPSIRVIDDMGQWVEVRKGIKDRKFAD
jgi:ubiquinone/menaquinone biosynthesis C-methylase UbiE